MSPSTPSASKAPPRLVPGDQIAPEALHAAFLAAFSDYLIGPFQTPLAQWPSFLARQGVDLTHSRVALNARDEPIAFAFASPRPLHRRWRLGTMGATPEARGSGAAPLLLDDFIVRAKAAWMTAVELEVFVQNERARRLYEGRGFIAAHPLYGFLAEPGTLPSHGQEVPRHVDTAAMLDWLENAERRIPDLPLQVCAAIVRQGQDTHAWQYGGGQLVFSLPDDTLLVHSLIAPDPDDAAALVRAAARAHPQRRLRVPQLLREDLGGSALRALGAVPQPLHQQLMIRPL